MGAGVSTKLRADSSRGAQWNVIRFYNKRGRGFEIKDVVIATGCTYKCVHRFFLELKKVGLLRRSGYRNHCSANWSLVRDIGPKPPVHRRDGMYDPNSKTLLLKQPKPLKQQEVSHG